MGKKVCNSGVPEEITKLSLSFKYNDIASVEKLFADYPDQIAGLIMEPMEFDFPKDDFLHKVQELCKKNGTVFILDEMITGLKLDFPGAHAMLGLDPDLTTWGKGVANGYSVCMLAGKREIMELGGLQHDKERVFLISTTHGAETHALAGAMATLEYTRDNKTIEGDKQMGIQVKTRIQKLIDKHDLSKYVEIKGHPCWLLMLFKDADEKYSDGMKTLIFQEMVKYGVLFRGTFNFSPSHSQQDIDTTIDVMDNAFAVYKNALNEGWQNYLVGEPVKPVFRKYNNR
jgi:glutamate-1-semialdehyde 2,1-aminomutase